MDPAVIEKDMVYSGGGSSDALTYMSPGKIRLVNGAKMVRVRK
jgi:hypothetical protein